jgi:peroxiredoxin
MSDPQPADPSSTDAPTPGWRIALRWLERAAWVGLALFLLHRLGPQIGALTGVGSEGDPVPDLTVATLDGDTITSAQLRGKVVVLNFWATWCMPCRLEMPSLEKLHREHPGGDVVVLGLSTDVGSEKPIREFLAERDISYPVGRATPAQRRDFGGIRGIPTTFVIGRAGVVRHRVVGYFAPPALHAAVNRLLEEPAP